MAGSVIQITLMVMLCVSVSKQSMIFSRIDGRYTSTDSRCQVRSRTECAVMCKVDPGCHGFTYQPHVCYIGKTAQQLQEEHHDDTWNKHRLEIETTTTTPSTTTTKQTTTTKGIQCPRDFRPIPSAGSCFIFDRVTVKHSEAMQRCHLKDSRSQPISLDSEVKVEEVEKYLVTNKKQLGFGTWVRVGAKRIRGSKNFRWENGETLSEDNLRWCEYVPRKYDCLSLRVYTDICFETTHCDAGNSHLCEITG